MENGKGLEIISPSAGSRLEQQQPLLCQPPGKLGELSSLPAKEEHNLEGTEDKLGPRHLQLPVPGTLQAPGGGGADDGQVLS